MQNVKKMKIIIEKKIIFLTLWEFFIMLMTQFLGYKNYGDEYKIMGLAAYGKPIYFDKILINFLKIVINCLVWIFQSS